MLVEINFQEILDLQKYLSYIKKISLSLKEAYIYPHFPINIFECNFKSHSNLILWIKKHLDTCILNSQKKTL